MSGMYVDICIQNGIEYNETKCVLQIFDCRFCDQGTKLNKKITDLVRY
jgi:hypothetical protein